jgi:hypothetical protein
MDIEKTMEFILEQQAEFATHQAASAQQVEALGQAVRDLLQVATLQSERLDSHDRRLEVQEKRMEAQEKQLEAQEKRLEMQEKRSEAFERRFDQFLERFDAYLRGRGGNGR